MDELSKFKNTLEDIRDAAGKLPSNLKETDIAFTGLSNNADKYLEKLGNMANVKFLVPPELPESKHEVEPSKNQSSIRKGFAEIEKEVVLATPPKFDKDDKLDKLTEIKQPLESSKSPVMDVRVINTDLNHEDFRKLQETIAENKLQSSQIDKTKTEMQDMTSHREQEQLSKDAAIASQNSEPKNKSFADMAEGYFKTGDLAGIHKKIEDMFQNFAKMFESGDKKGAMSAMSALKKEIGTIGEALGGKYNNIKDGISPGFANSELIGLLAKGSTEGNLRAIPAMASGFKDFGEIIFKGGKDYLQNSPALDPIKQTDWFKNLTNVFEAVQEKLKKFTVGDDLLKEIKTEGIANFAKKFTDNLEKDLDVLRGLYTSFSKMSKEEVGKFLNYFLHNGGAGANNMPFQPTPTENKAKIQPPEEKSYHEQRQSQLKPLSETNPVNDLNNQTSRSNQSPVNFDNDITIVIRDNEDLKDEISRQMDKLAQQIFIQLSRNMNNAIGMNRAQANNAKPYNA